MTKKQYAAYLCSEHWKELRSRVLLFQSSCERCMIPRWLAGIVYDQDLHVHHKTYANLGHEVSADLEVLCRRCHDIETHGRSDLNALKSTNCGICDRVHWDLRADFCAFCNETCRTRFLSNLTDTQRNFMNEEDFDNGSYFIQMMEILMDSVIFKRELRESRADE